MVNRDDMIYAHNHAASFVYYLALNRISLLVPGMVELGLWRARGEYEPPDGQRRPPCSFLGYKDSWAAGPKNFLTAGPTTQIRFKAK